ncbi:phenylalanine--tRNA ligase beta subunit-related protein [Cystobacter fuscus]|uniref:phenylalanine--tRNA ligase beta subunit-related protein n=1 Tax=Cystobacter fuscus TaxID=43 RepID=UPI002B30C3C3|nr:B3/4 domain-containing protein [Cystobacter fuscus]
MQKLIVHKTAYELGIKNPVACILDGVLVREGRQEALDEPVARVVEMIQAGLPQQRPETAGFADLFEALGYSQQLPAGQRLVEGITRKGFPRYNNVVDAGNVVSAMYCSGLGLHDASGLRDDLVVGRATGEEEIIPLFKNKPQRLGAGDLLYASGGRPLAWLGRRDVDAHDFRIVNDTRSLLCIALGNARTGRDFNQEICEHFIRLIRLTCPDVTVRFLETEVPSKNTQGE